LGRWKSPGTLLPGTGILTTANCDGGRTLKATIKIDAFIQVRLSSTRVPGKALIMLGDDTCLGHVERRVRQASCLSDIIVCTSIDASDDPLVEFATKRGLAAFRGDPHDCLERFLRCAEAFKSDVIVRVCGDSPLIEPDVIDGAARLLVAEEFDYVHSPALPVGAYVEVFTAAALERAALAAKDGSLSDHLTYFLRRTEINRVGEYEPPVHLRRPDLVLALNRPEDLEVLARVFEADASGKDLTLADAISYLNAHPEFAAMNANYVPEPTRCDIRLDPRRLPPRSRELPWYAPLGSEALR
jgi:spore coat polysaccharide biosynthesis protein SpsF (cytidylyltransferase family)